MTDVTLPDNEPTRKQRFSAAIDLAGLTLKQWCETVYPTSPAYVYRILMGREDGGVEINSAIDATIAKYLPDVRVMTVPRATVEAAERATQSVEDSRENGGNVFGGHAA